MASTSKPLRDWLYLWIIGTQLLGMIVIDLVPFYPSSLYLPPSSPLHFLLSIRHSYVSFSGDPFFAHPITQPCHKPFLQIFLLIELLVQLPLAAFLVRRLASGLPTSGPVELAGLAFGCVTGMGSAACFYELLMMGPEDVRAEKKAGLVYGTYLPFLVIPSLMAVDMYVRLLARVQEPSKAKTKTQ